tara:strand:- start:746 stop:2230 length:1485 start_codon:yes stop_codon:yes gene_type:complete
VALRLRSNGAPLSGALFVSNPRKRKRKASTRKRKRNTASTRSAAAKRNRRKTTRTSAAAKRRRAAALRSLRNRRNKRKMARNRRNSLALRMNRRNSTVAAGATVNRRRRRSTKRRRTTRRRNSLALKTNRRNRRNGTRKGMVRKTARRAYTRRRRNTNAMGVFGNRLSAPIQRLVGKVPVIGSIAKQFVAPLVIGAAAGAVHYYGVKALQRYAPGVAERVKPVQFTVAGSLVATILLAGGKLPGLKMISAKTRKQVAAAALILGGGLDTYRYLSRTMGDLGAEEPLYDFSGLGVDLDGLGVDLGESMPLYDYSGLGIDMSGAHDMSGVHMSGVHMNGLGVDLGDGGAYDVVPLQGAHDLGYGAADFSDALFAPDDLSVEEGEMALAGAQHFGAAFGPCPVVRSRKVAGASPLVGRPGHRFGWLIRLVGFQRFQAIAALPPQQRVALIQKMKAQAIALADEQQMSAEANSLGGLGVDLGGLGMDLGATLHAGSVF